MTEREMHEPEMVKAQTSLLVRRAGTEFRMVGIAALAAGAVLGGTIVGALLGG